MEPEEGPRKVFTRAKPLIVLKRCIRFCVWVYYVLTSFLRACVEVGWDVARHWLTTGADSIAPTFLKRQHVLREMAGCANYREWRRKALHLDRMEGNQAWKMRYECADYDYDLVRDCLEDLYRARKRDDRQRLAFHLRSTLNRDLGGMGNSVLYRRCHVGTKDLIEKYIDEVVYDLNYLSSVEIPCMTPQEKTDLFVRTRAAFGRTALLLSGGGGLGIFHLGVLKALFEEDLLPRIISGSSVGSLVGALICVTPEPELPLILNGNTPSLKNTFLITRAGEPASWWDKLMHFVRYGVLADVEVLKEACQANIGDITFVEAYHRTRRILNITVNSRDQHEVPRLLNYLTAPNVVIWSAACASCALGGLFAPVEILEKTSTGELRPWNPPGQKWSDGSVESDLPMQRLAELFNVNHFIVSQVNPHVVPVLRSQRFFPSWCGGLLIELQHRLDQLIAAGVLPQLMRNIKTVCTQRYQGHITIVPDIALEDYLSIVSNPSPERFQRAVRIGQLATWPKMSLITNHLKIELALDGIVFRLRGCEKWQLN